MELRNSETYKNLMRGFVAESQAITRYLFAAELAKKENLQVIEKVFEYTAEQERAHARIYSNYLKEFSGTGIEVDARYPIDSFNTTLEQLQGAVRNEYREHDIEYAKFAEIAKNEGFKEISDSFTYIAGIEKTHGDRFDSFVKLINEDKLFKSDKEEQWLCLNCGYIHTSKDAPDKCPSCKHPQGFFVRKELSPYS